MSQEANGISPLVYRYDDFRERERSRLDRRYRGICRENLSKFKRLQLPAARDMTPELIQAILNPVESSATKSGSSKTNSATHKQDKTENADEEQPNTNKEDGELTLDLHNLETTNTDDSEDKEADGKDDSEEDEEDEEPETPDWYMSRRRFTLAALNEVTDHTAEQRRCSEGTANLAAVLGVRLPELGRPMVKKSKVKEDSNEPIKEVDNETDSEGDKNNNCESKEEHIATDDSDHVIETDGDNGIEPSDESNEKHNDAKNKSVL